MQPVFFMDERVGSFTWVLPQEFENDIGKLPEDVQILLRKKLEMQLKRHLRVLIAAVKMRESAEKAMDIIKRSDEQLSKRFRWALTSGILS